MHRGLVKLFEKQKLGDGMEATSSFQLHTGNAMPIFGLGTWQLTIDTAETVSYAIKLGYPLIDTSSDYGTHQGIGQAIKNSNVNRDDIYIVTKVEETDDAYERTKSNLKELQLEYIDLMLIHRPPISGAGEELWNGLIKAKKDGLTRDIGVSNYSATLIEQLIDDSGEIPTVNQIEWSPFGYSEEMMTFCEDNKIIIQAYSPLTRAKRLDDETLIDIGNNYEKSTAQVLLRWSLQSGACPIPKANQREHLEEDIAIFDFELTDEEMAILNDLNEEYSTFNSPLPYIERM